MPSRNPVSTMSTMRPSTIADVSTSLGGPPASVAAAVLGTGTIRVLAPMRAPRYDVKIADDEIQHDCDVRAGTAHIGDQLEDDSLDEKRNEQSNDQTDRAPGDLRRRKPVDRTFGDAQLAFEKRLRDRRGQRAEQRTCNRRTDEKGKLHRLTRKMR